MTHEGHEGHRVLRARSAAQSTFEQDDVRVPFADGGKEGLTVSRPRHTARVAALFYLATADASVACWDAKYFYNFWRPEPAIRRGDQDGNPATVAEPNWQPFLPTPPHPDYLSGHTGNSGAMATVLRLVFGDTPGFIIEATSSQNVGFVRYWQTFSEGLQEVIDARPPRATLRTSAPCIASAIASWRQWSKRRPR